MLKLGLPVALWSASLLAGPAVVAQAPTGPASVCTAGTHFTTIRHSTVKAGQWAVFEQAVAEHNAWYASHGNKTSTKLARVIATSAAGPALSTAEAVTITSYADMVQPPHDVAYSGFIAKYRASSDMKDEARICMP